MTELSTDRAGAHWASALRVSGGVLSTERTDVFRAMGAYVVQGLALEALCGCRDGRFRGVGTVDRVATGSGLHNHLQSSGECNMSRAHSRSTSSANPSPASLSRHSVATISFSWGKGRCSSETTRERVGSSGQLGSWIDGSVGRGQGLNGRRTSCRSRGTGVGSSRLGYPAFRLLRNLLLHWVTAVVSLALFLREGEENGAENVGEVIPGESPQEPVESSIHQQDKHSGADSGQGGVEGLGDLYG